MTGQRQDIEAMNLSWKKPLVYLLAPILVVLCFVGFPPPFPPPRGTKAAQEQSAPAEVDDEKQQT